MVPRCLNAMLKIIPSYDPDPNPDANSNSRSNVPEVAVEEEDKAEDDVARAEAGENGNGAQAEGKDGENAKKAKPRRLRQVSFEDRPEPRADRFNSCHHRSRGLDPHTVVDLENDLLLLKS